MCHLCSSEEKYGAMKRILSFIAVVCSVVLIGCQTDSTTEISNVGENSLTISLEGTRLSLGNKVNDEYPLYWSEGDCIVVNGEKSKEANIDSSNRSCATFEFSSTLSYPYCITHPYCSATTSTQPVVEFKQQQYYTENSFDMQSLPICGYAESNGKKIEISHLAGLLRLPVKASVSGVALKEITITSTSNGKLAGVFAVDCAQAELTAHGETVNTITYHLPSDFTLSSSEEIVFYISLPAVNAGECRVEFVEASGAKMTANWRAGQIESGIVREFKTITYKQGDATSLDSFEREDDFIITDSVSGYVRDNSGQPIEGVAVSDGYTIVTTDSNGHYSFDASSDAWHIFITVPAEYEIPIKDGQPDFYQKYSKKQYRYDFTLTPLAGGKEEKFALFVIGDPQVADANGLNLLNSKAVPAIKEHAATWQAKGIPCYGITLGDLISNNNNSDRSQWRQPVFNSFAVPNTGMPVFHVMGNHDHTFFNSAKPIYADERSSSFELKAQRDHEDVYGPANFSFNRGDMHIISMRNLLYNRNDDCGAGLRRSFLKEQYQWLQQDLALVPKDKTVILCVHLPMLDGGGSYVDMTRELINEYKEAHIMSGHSHYIQAIGAAKQPNIYEHNMGALCGAWWTSHMCGDGSPAGYGVFVCEGATFTDWYHVGYDATSKNRSHQMRLYRGNAVTGTKRPNSNMARGYYAFNFDEDVLLANVYMADSQWSIKVYEDGEYSGDMEHVSTANILTDKAYYTRPKIYVDETTTPSTDGAGYGYMLGDGSLENPYCSSLPTAGDIYATGFINGVCGYGDYKVGSNSPCYHMYMYKLKNKEASIMVEATDRFGNIYTETKITTGTDYSLVTF